MEYQNLQNLAYDYLKNALVSGKLDPNTVHSVSNISREINMSRTPVRDALQRLSQEGYIDILPSRGFKIHLPSEREVGDAFHIRSAIECYCCTLIARDPASSESKKACLSLQKCLQEQEASVQRGDSPGMFMRFDVLFHKIITDFADCSEFLSLCNFDSVFTRDMMWRRLSQPGQMEQSLAEHRTVLRALEQGDSDACYRTLLTHLRKTFDTYRKSSHTSLK